MEGFQHAREVFRMYRNLPAPVQGLFSWQAGVFQPALIEEFSGAIRSSQPYRHGYGVNQEANVFGPSRLCGPMLRRFHPRIIVRLATHLEAYAFRKPDQRTQADVSVGCIQALGWQRLAPRFHGEGQEYQPEQ